MVYLYKVSKPSKREVIVEIFQKGRQLKTKYRSTIHLAWAFIVVICVVQYNMDYLIQLKTTYKRLGARKDSELATVMLYEGKGK